MAKTQTNMQTEKSRLIERALWQYALTRVGVVASVFPLLALLFGLHAGLDLQTSISVVLEKKSHSHIQKGNWFENTGFWVVDAHLDGTSNPASIEDWETKTHRHQSYFILSVVSLLGVAVLFWAVCCYIFIRSGFLKPPRVFDNLSFFVRRFLTGWKRTKEWTIVWLTIGLVTFLVHTDASCYLISVPLLIALFITPDILLKDELKSSCLRLRCFLAGLTLLNIPLIVSFFLKEGTALNLGLQSFSLGLNAFFLLVLAIVLFTQLPHSYRLRISHFRKTLNLIFLALGVVVVFVPFLHRWETAIALLAGVGILIPFFVFTGVCIQTSRVNKKVLSVFEENEVTETIPQSEILESDGFYVIARPSYSHPVIADDITNNEGLESFTFGGWYSRLRISEPLGADYYVIRRTSLHKVPFGVHGDDFTARMGEIFRGMMISARTNKFVDKLRLEIEKPWCVARVVTSQTDLALTKCPWDNPDVLILLSTKNIPLTIPFDAGLLDREGYLYEATVNVRISLNKTATDALDHFKDNPLSQDEEYGKVVRDLIEGSRLVVKEVYCALILALFDAREHISIMENYNLDSQELNIDDSIRAYFTIEVGAVIPWSDEKEDIQELFKMKQLGAAGYRTHIQVDAVRRANQWKKKVLVSKHIEDNLDYIDKWLGEAFDDPVQRIGDICTAKGNATKDRFDQVEEELRAREQLCKAALKKHIEKAKQLLNS